MFPMPDGRGRLSPRATGRAGALPALTIMQLAANTSKASSSFAAHSWLAADVVLDEPAAWSPANPTRIAVPAGYTRCRVTLQPSWASAGGATRWAYIVWNGDSTKITMEDNRTAANEGASVSTSIWLTDLRIGDYFEVTFAQATAGSLNLTGSSTRLAVATRVQVEWAP